MIKTVFPINFLARFFITVYNMASWYSVQKIRKNYAKMPTGNHFSHSSHFTCISVQIII